MIFSIAFKKNILFLLIICIKWIEIYTIEFVYENRLKNLQYFEDKIYSQNGEDGILLVLLDIIGIKSKYYVEFGVENGMECNTRILREKLNFTGLLMDGGNENKDINLNREFITERNIIDLFNNYNVPQSFDVLSVDVDMFDWWILLRILRDSSYKPRIIIVETNPTLCLEETSANNNIKEYIKQYSKINAEPLVVIHPNMTDQLVWDATRYAGANPLAFRLLGEEFGYEMVYCERCGVNCFLVLKSELPHDNNNNNILSPFYAINTPYQCFGTVQSGDNYAGHIVDKHGRESIKITSNLMKDLISISNNDSIIINKIIESKYSCSSNSNEIGVDYCTFLYPVLGKCDFIIKISIDDSINLYEEYNICQYYNKGIELFDEKKYTESIDIFEIISKNHIKIYNDCQSFHTSELSCIQISRVYYNLAILFLNIQRYNEALGALIKSNEYDNSNKRIKKIKDFVNFLLFNYNDNHLNHSIYNYEQLIFDFKMEGETNIISGIIGGGVCDDIEVKIEKFGLKYGLNKKQLNDIQIQLFQKLHNSIFQNIQINIYDDNYNFYNLLKKYPKPSLCLQQLVLNSQIQPTINDICKIRKKEKLQVDQILSPIIVLGPPGLGVNIITKLVNFYINEANESINRDDDNVDKINIDIMNLLGCNILNINNDLITDSCLNSTLLSKGHLRLSDDNLNLNDQEMLNNIIGKRIYQLDITSNNNFKPKSNVYGSNLFSFTSNIWEDPLGNSIYYLILSPPVESISYISIKYNINFENSLNIWYDYFRSCLLSMKNKNKIILLEYKHYNAISNNHNIIQMVDDIINSLKELHVLSKSFEKSIDNIIIEKEINNIEKSNSFIFNESYDIKNKIPDWLLMCYNKVITSVYNGNIIPESC